MNKDTLKKLCIGGIIVLAIVIPVLNKAIPYFRVVIAYEEAEELIAQENFSEAHTLLMSIYFDNDDYRLSHYKDTSKLIHLCQSHFAYDQGDIEKAYEEFNIWDLKIGMDYQTEEQAKAIAAYCAKVNIKYEPIVESKARQEEAEELEKAQSGFPYVGMKEKYIKDTLLGDFSYDVTTGTMYENGKSYETRTYKFYIGSRHVFSATCSMGFVRSIVNWMDTPEPTSSSKSTVSESDSDPYKASSYRNAERFYEANYGHFDSFEDAEYYYYKHKDD